MKLNGYLRQLFILGFEGKTIPQEFKPLLRRVPIGGIILFEENIEDTNQLRELVKEAQSLTPLPLLVMIDQEGGEKNRITKGITQFPQTASMGREGISRGRAWPIRRRQRR